jgi:hypothetical protein
MQEHGVPVTYAYISDAHDKHPSGPVYGPGEAGYVAALKTYDSAFAAFFRPADKRWHQQPEHAVRRSSLLPTRANYTDTFTKGERVAVETLGELFGTEWQQMGN